jgi:hypothetical protein
MVHFKKILLATTVLSGVLQTPTTWAQTAIDPIKLLDQAIAAEFKTPFTGEREQQVTRMDQIRTAIAQVRFVDRQNFQFELKTPAKVNGLQLNLEANSFKAYLPQEALYFQNESSVGVQEPLDLILSHLGEDKGLLLQNYSLKVLPQTEVVNLQPCDVLVAIPKGGFKSNAGCGRRFWISRENKMVLKEERFWAEYAPAFFISRFTKLDLKASTLKAIKLPSKHSALKFKAGSPTTFKRYTTVANARKAGHIIVEPTLGASGFVLKAVDVMSIYGTDIVLLRYSDGLNQMTVTYRPKGNAFIAMVAGAFALGLVDKISELSFHAPNNYGFVDKNGSFIYAYGDLWQEELNKIAGSVKLQPVK